MFIYLVIIYSFLFLHETLIINYEPDRRAIKIIKTWPFLESREYNKQIYNKKNLIQCDK